MTNKLKLKKIFILVKKYPQTAARLLFSKIVEKINLQNYFKLAPQLVVLNVAEACNLRCPMCLVWESRDIFGKSNAEKNNFSIEAVQQIVDQVKGFKPMFYFVGGEPTLNPDLIKIISYIHEKGMITSLTTNGWLLSDFAQDFVEKGIDFVSVSLDNSQAEFHDKNRGVVGSFERTIKGIEKLVDIKRRNKTSSPNIKINTVITPWNVDDLENVVILAKKIGVDELTFENFSFYGPQITEMNVKFVEKNTSGSVIMGMPISETSIFDEKTITKINLFLKSLPRLSKKYGLTISSFPKTNNYEAYYRGDYPSLRKSKCFVPWNTMTIRGSGDVEACQGYVIGNIKKNKIMDLWDNDQFKRFRNVIYDKHVTPACYRCCNLYSCFK